MNANQHIAPPASPPISELTPKLPAPEDMIDGVPYRENGEGLRAAFPIRSYAWFDAAGKRMPRPEKEIGGAPYILTSMEGEIHVYHLSEWNSGCTFYFMGGGNPGNAKMIAPAHYIFPRSERPAH